MKTKKLILALLVAGAAAGPGAWAGSLLESIRAGDAAGWRGVALEERDERGNTPLLNAIISGNLETVKALVASGANVNATNRGGSTALMLAAGDYAKTKLLVEHGAEVNARSALGNTPLILAARPQGSAKAVALLLECGAEVNATNVFGATALMSAAASGDTRTAKVLLERGAEVNAQSRGIIDTAIWGGGRSPLMWASFHGDLAMMKLLLKHGAKVNEQEAFGTALTQAAWMDRPEAARLLLTHGAEVNTKEFFSGFTALHWAAQSENGSDELTKLLLKHGANPNADGGEPVDAYLGISQTPTMLAQKRGETDILRALTALGGKTVPSTEKPQVRREVVEGFNADSFRLAIDRALPSLERSAVRSKSSFVNHASKQDCVSCHQQYSPMMAFALAAQAGRNADARAEAQVLEMVRRDNTNLYQLTSETSFHPEPAHGYGYALLAMAAQKEPATAETDAMIHHLLVIQAKNGQWFNNLPRAPIQTSDAGATALAVHALAKYGSPARKAEIQERIGKARQWLWDVRARNNEERVYQLLGLVWAGEDSAKLRGLAADLKRQQRADGGWAQLPNLESDAYATGQALYALRLAGVKSSATEFRRGLKFLLETQREDGTWLVNRRAFPFQPTMNSGYPHGRDSWVSASGASWATIALSLALREEAIKISSAR